MEQTLKEFRFESERAVDGSSSMGVDLEFTRDQQQSTDRLDIIPVKASSHRAMSASVWSPPIE